MENSQPGGSFKIRGIAHTMQVSIPLGYLQEKGQLQKGNFSTMFSNLSAGRMVKQLRF
jgi:hypothetical protein